MINKVFGGAKNQKLEFNQIEPKCNWVHKKTTTLFVPILLYVKHPTVPRNITHSCKRSKNSKLLLQLMQMALVVIMEEVSHMRQRMACLSDC